MVFLESRALLLKTQNENSVDQYEILLKSNQIEVKLIKTLLFEYKNIEILAEKLSRSEDYSGIIFSSPRCVQAVNLASRKTIGDLSLWMSKNNFAVGEATGQEAYEKLNLECTGQHSGAAINLVKIIITDKSKYEKPFLYPHGSLKTDTITKELEQETIKLDSILVYNTIQNPNIEQDIKEATNNLEDVFEYIVFFSPSGVYSSLKYLRNSTEFSRTKIIAFGPTTEAALKEENLPVYGVAKHPTPQGILDVILKK